MKLTTIVKKLLINNEIKSLDGWTFNLVKPEETGWNELNWGRLTNGSSTWTWCLGAMSPSDWARVTRNILEKFQENK